MKVPWTEHKTNEEILKMVETEIKIMDTIRSRQQRWLGHILRHDSLLRIMAIWRRMCVNINGLGDLDLSPFDLETGMLVASNWETFIPNLGTTRPSNSRVICYVCDGRTDGRTYKRKVYCPPFLWVGA